MSFVGRLLGFGRDDHYDRGIQAYDRGEYDLAIAEFRYCLEHSTEPTTIRLAKFYTAESYAQIGSQSLKSSDPEDAIKNLLSALEMHPTYPDLHFQLAVAYRTNGQYEEQVQHLERALELNPGYSAAMLLLGVVWYEGGRHEEALAKIAHAVEIEPGLSNIRYHEAITAHRAGDFEMATRHLNGMRNPDAILANALAKEGDGFAREGQWTNAADKYAAALEICPRYADIRCKYGKAKFQLGDIPGSIEQFEIALEINPRYADAHAHYGLALRASGQENKAIAEFKAALESNPEHDVARDQLNESKAA